MTLYYKKMHTDAKAPVYATAGAAGFDLSYCGDERIPLEPGERARIPTGLAFEVPIGYELQIRPRSGFALAAGVTVLNSPGTIDSDYRGEVFVILANLGSVKCTVSPGDRIAQAVFAPVAFGELVERETLTPTDRGEGGFGSTGVRSVHVRSAPVRPGYAEPKHAPTCLPDPPPEPSERVIEGLADAEAGRLLRMVRGEPLPVAEEAKLDDFDRHIDALADKIAEDQETRIPDGELGVYRRNLADLVAGSSIGAAETLDVLETLADKSADDQERIPEGEMRKVTETGDHTEDLEATQISETWWLEQTLDLMRLDMAFGPVPFYTPAAEIEDTERRVHRALVSNGKDVRNAGAVLLDADDRVVRNCSSWNPQIVLLAMRRAGSIYAPMWLRRCASAREYRRGES